MSIACLVRDNVAAFNGLSTGDGAGIHATSADNRIEGNAVLSNDRGIHVPAGVSGNLIVKNSASDNTVSNFDTATDNPRGPIAIVANAEDISAVANSDHHWANFVY